MDMKLVETLSPHILVGLILLGFLGYGGYRFFFVLGDQRERDLKIRQSWLWLCIGGTGGCFFGSLLGWGHQEMSLILKVSATMGVGFFVSIVVGGVATFLTWVDK